MVPDQEQSPAGIDQIEHDTQSRRAVRTLVDQIAKLHDEAVSRDRIGEAPRVTVHVANDAQGNAVRDPPLLTHAARSSRGAGAVRAQARPVVG
jgi:hypothetical protein